MSNNEKKADALAYLSGCISELTEDEDTISSEELKDVFNKSLEEYDLGDNEILRIE